jgi:hypothetical protein
MLPVGSFSREPSIGYYVSVPRSFLLLPHPLYNHPSIPDSSWNQWQHHFVTVDYILYPPIYQVQRWKNYILSDVIELKMAKKSRKTPVSAISLGEADFFDNIIMKLRQKPSTSTLCLLVGRIV